MTLPNFIISLNNFTGGKEFEIKITNMEGQPVYESIGQIPSSNSSYQFTWNSATMNTGVYFYSVKVDGKLFAGKMVKI